MTDLRINPPEQRRDPRFDIDVPAQLLLYRRSLPVSIADISSNGAMLSGDELPDQGDEVVLAKDAFEVVATVMWVVGERCGLRLHRTVDADALVRAWKTPRKLIVKH